MPVLKAIVVWLLILVCAVINGALRERFLIPKLGTVAAFAASGLLVCLCVMVVSAAFVPWFGPLPRASYLSLGVFWLFLALAFEFGFGHSALYELKLLAAPYKANFVRACVGIAFTDQTLSVAEGELLRAICASIDSPLPPLVAEATIDVRPGVQAQVAR